MFEIAKPFLLSLALGLMVGIERERAFKGTDHAIPFGARTFSLIALFGALAAHLGSPGFAFVAAAFVAAIAVAAYVRPVEGGRDVGTTTEIAAVMTFGLGWLAVSEPQLAAMLGVIVVAVLWLKAKIHDFAHKGLTDQEVKAALIFLVIALVVLPLLPNEPVDPWAIVNPAKLWLLFVLIAGLGFAGYIAVRALGPERGLAAAGFFAGFVSSTAATLTLSKRAASQPSFAGSLATGIVLANVASAIAQLFIVGIADRNLVQRAGIMLGAAIVVGAVAAFAAVKFLSRGPETAPGAEFELSNPLELKSAFLMASGFAVVLVIAAVASRAFGGYGAIATAAVVGTTDVHAASLATATLSAAGSIEPGQALLAILLAFLVNMVVKLTMLGIVGGRRLLVITAPPLAAMAIAAVAAYVLAV